MRVISPMISQGETIDDVRERMLEARGERVRISYSDGKVDVTISARVGTVTPTMVVVDYDARERSVRVHQEGKVAKATRKSRSCHECFLLADILTGLVNIKMDD